MVVDEDLARRLRSSSGLVGALFAASCAERMAPLYLESARLDGGRLADVRFVEQVRDALWEGGAPGVEAADFVARLERFDEMVETEEEIVDTLETYRFYAILALRYAVLARSTGSVDEALSCAHASATAMFQFDQNLAGASFAQEERLAQARTFDEIDSRPGDAELLDVIRQTSREVGSRRWMALRTRVGMDG